MHCFTASSTVSGMPETKGYRQTTLAKMGTRLSSEALTFARFKHCGCTGESHQSSALKMQPQCLISFKTFECE